MKTSPSLPKEKKLSVTYRVEPGCLGPDGVKHIDEFCQYAQDNLLKLDSDYIVWNIVPRNDKTLPETQFNIVGKRMNHSQAEKYLANYGLPLDDFENHLAEKLAEFVDVFMKQ